MSGEKTNDKNVKRSRRYSNNPATSSRHQQAPLHQISGNQKGKTIASAIQGAVRDNQIISQTLTRNMAQRAAVSAEYERIAERAFINFNPSRTTDASRRDQLYFKRGDDLNELQKVVIEQGLTALDNSKVNHSIQLTLSDEEVTKYGLTKSADDGTVSGDMQVDDLMFLMESKSQGNELFSTPSFPFSSSGVITPCEAEREAAKRIKDFLDSKKTPSTESGPDADDHAHEHDKSHLTAEAMVKEKVDLQMRTATSPETQLTYGISKRGDQNDIRNNVEAFEIKGGPADVTSVHDFHRLQIAFEHIWSEIIDNRIPYLGKILYALNVKTKAFAGIDAVNGSINSVDELKDFLYRVRATLEGSVENDPRYQEVVSFINISFRDWCLLDDSVKDAIYNWTFYGLDALKKFILSQVLGHPEMHYVDTYNNCKELAQQMFRSAYYKKSRLEKLLGDLDKLLTKPYPFTVYAPNSINFGVLATYRQEWEPLNYQVGNLVSTIPLAPQEVQRYTKKVVEKKQRNVKEMDDALQIRKKESTDTSRVESEIVEKAKNTTNFKLTADESGTIGFATIHASQALDRDQSKESSETKKQFREAVLKSAQEYKQEHRLEINTDSSAESEIVTFHEIRNPNDELPVTYLFYELQRTYQISEKLHKLTPVILVANDVPAPEEINESWLLAHDWILKRVILDDSFIPALENLSKSLVGNEISLEILRMNMEKQEQLMEQIGQQIKTQDVALVTFQAALDTAVQNYKNAEASGGGGRSTIETIADPIGITKFLGGGGSGGTKPDYEAYKLSISSAQDALERAQKHADELRSRLETEITALQTAVDKYSEAVSLHFNQQTQTDRLRVHIIDNILYYMQAIWSHEPTDQRFFRLLFTVPVISYSSSGASTAVKTHHGPAVTIEAKKKHVVEAKLPVASFKLEFKELVEVADIESLLGFKGNYMIFPLKENNYLTYCMMQDYIHVDDIVSIHDPELVANYSLEQLERHMKCVYEKDPHVFEQFEEKYKELILQRLLSPYPEKDIVVVPTTSLYIEALPGKHPILEDFKLLHRALDVKKVQADVRHAELENVRLASRALKGKDEDPDIEKKIIIDGDAKHVTIAHHDD